MNAFKLLCVVFFACGCTLAEAKTVTLRCSPGYTISVTIELHVVLTEAEREAGEASTWTRTLSCPPDQTFELPAHAQPYDGLHAEWDMTDPNGVDSSGSLPPAPGPNDPPPGRYAVWGSHPLAPTSYICNSRSCVEDPIAPTFIQPGEFVIGSYDEGSTFDLTTVVLDAKSMQPIPNSNVIIHLERDDSKSAEGSTGASGRKELSLKAGDTYYIQVESSGYFPQRSDSFQLFRDHEWRMLMMAESTASQNHPINWIVWPLLFLVFILVILIVRRR